MEPIVKDLMTSHIIVLNLSDSVCKAKHAFSEMDIHHLPVVREGKLVGMLSSNDLPEWDADASDKKEQNESILDQSTIEALMTAHPISISPNAPISTAEQTMQDYGFNALTVLQNDRLIGVISSTDLRKYQETLEQTDHLSD